LGEISPEEFGKFIGENIRLQPVMLLPEVHIQSYLNIIWERIRLRGRILSLII
jgi:hypothetical protein